VLWLVFVLFLSMAHAEMGTHHLQDD